jgi:hypothetical protein
MSSTIEDIQKKRKAGHDTVYCSYETKQRIIDEINGTGVGLTADVVQVAGLDVIAHECFDETILCQKGTVFPLARDYRAKDYE